MEEEWKKKKKKKKYIRMEKGLGVHREQMKKMKMVKSHMKTMWTTMQVGHNRMEVRWVLDTE